MGLNLLHKGDGRVLNLGAKNSISLQPGVSLYSTNDILCIDTVCVIVKNVFLIYIYVISSKSLHGRYLNSHAGKLNPFFTCLPPPAGHILPLHTWWRRLWEGGRLKWQAQKQAQARERVFPGKGQRL